MKKKRDEQQLILQRERESLKEEKEPSECLDDRERKPEMELIQMQNTGSSVEECPAVGLEDPLALVALLH